VLAIYGYVVNKTANDDEKNRSWLKVETDAELISRAMLFTSNPRQFIALAESYVTQPPHRLLSTFRGEQESPANAKVTRDSSACMKAHCEQM